MAKKTLVKSNKIQGLEKGDGIVFITFPNNWRDILQGQSGRYDIPADEFEELFGDVFKKLKLYTIYYVIINDSQFVLNNIIENEINTIIYFGFNFGGTKIDTIEGYHIEYNKNNNTYVFEYHSL